MRAGSEHPPAEPDLHVLVVDDSAVVRQTLGAILSQTRGMTVTTAADPLIAMDKMRSRRPDVILLDLEMPRMDGLTFLRQLMSRDPIPVVVCSGIAQRGTEAAFHAIEEGAVEVVVKPQISVRDFLEESAVLLVDAVRAAARARRPARVRAAGRPVAAAGRDAARPQPLLRLTTDKIVAIGASTGGTEALRLVFEAMPPDAPGIVAVQHMPEVFTRTFAERLDRLCQIEVKEAAHGDRVRSGRALIAPGNRHMRVVRTGAHYEVEISDGPLVLRHRPSVDVLFRSVAAAAGPNAVGVILTGMGDDGAAGLAEMKRRGSATMAQDEQSCVVFGMPREAIELGAVDEVVPLSRVPGSILHQAARQAGAPTGRNPRRGS
jgi:two-component system chemotaxis response regulator CheB